MTVHKWQLTGTIFIWPDIIETKKKRIIVLLVHIWFCVFLYYFIILLKFIFIYSIWQHCFTTYSVLLTCGSWQFISDNWQELIMNYFHVTINVGRFCWEPNITVKQKRIISLVTLTFLSLSKPDLLLTKNLLTKNSCILCFYSSNCLLYLNKIQDKRTSIFERFETAAADRFDRLVNGNKTLVTPPRGR